MDDVPAEPAEDRIDGLANGGDNVEDRGSDAKPTGDAAAAAKDSNITVAIRMRPTLQYAPGVAPAPPPWQMGSDVGVGAILDLTAGERWNFDHVYGPEQATHEIYKGCVRDVVLSLCDGINGTVFAYGQTASGKTYTMYGDCQSTGLVPECVREIYDVLATKQDSIENWSISVSLIEIYNEQVTDLLVDTCANGGAMAEVKLQDDESGNLQLKGLSSHEVFGPQEILGHLVAGDARRHKGETRMNEQSSRSHTVLRISLDASIISETGLRRCSQLHLVDLAGSEGLKKTASTGERRREGSNINRSLHALSKVIQALSDDVSRKTEKQQHVAFRDSKLTRILRPALGGNSHTIVVCTVSSAASNYGETKSTLEFASRAKKVRNKVKVNLCEDGKDKVIRLQQELVILRSELSGQRPGGVGDSSALLADTENTTNLYHKVQQLQAELNAEVQGLMASKPPSRRRTIAGRLSTSLYADPAPKGSRLSRRVSTSKVPPSQFPLVADSVGRVRRNSCDGNLGRNPVAVAEAVEKDCIPVQLGAVMETEQIEEECQRLEREIQEAIQNLDSLEQNLSGSLSEEEGRQDGSTSFLSPCPSQNNSQGETTISRPSLESTVTAFSAVSESKSYSAGVTEFAPDNERAELAQVIALAKSLYTSLLVALDDPDFDRGMDGPDVDWNMTGTELLRSKLEQISHTVDAILVEQTERSAALDNIRAILIDNLCCQFGPNLSNSSANEGSSPVGGGSDCRYTEPLENALQITAKCEFEELPPSPFNDGSPAIRLTSPSDPLDTDPRPPQEVIADHAVMSENANASVDTDESLQALLDDVTKQRANLAVQIKEAMQVVRDETCSKLPDEASKLDPQSQPALLTRAAREVRRAEQRREMQKLAELEAIIEHYDFEAWEENLRGNCLQLQLRAAQSNSIVVAGGS